MVLKSNRLCSNLFTMTGSEIEPLATDVYFTDNALHVVLADGR